MKAIDNLITEARQAAEKCKGTVEEALLVGEFIGKVDSLLATDDATTRIRALVNSDIGFRTDREYQPEVIRRCVIDALWKGLRVVGNEFNIIGGRVYCTSAGYAGLLDRHPNIDGAIEVTVVTNEIDGNMAIMSGRVKFHYMTPGTRGFLPREESLDVRMRIVQGVGLDALEGKARRKLLKAAYDSVNGNVSTVVDGDIDDPEANAEPPAGQVHKFQPGDPSEHQDHPDHQGGQKTEADYKMCEKCGEHPVLTEGVCGYCYEKLQIEAAPSPEPEDAEESTPPPPAEPEPVNGEVEEARKELTSLGAQLQGRSFSDILFIAAIDKLDIEDNLDRLNEAIDKCHRVLKKISAKKNRRLAAQKAAATRKARGK